MSEASPIYTPFATRDDARAHFGARITQWNVAPHLRGGLERYLVDHVRPGSFLAAALANDLWQAALYADVESLLGLPALMRFLQTHAPADSWGSAAAVDRWTTHRIP